MAGLRTAASSSAGKRVFCCTPPDCESPFLPVPLEYLFPDPPTEGVTKFKLQVDDTFGGKVAQGSQTPKRRQLWVWWSSLRPRRSRSRFDRRDGSHWDVYNCLDAVTESEHTVQMVCGDDSESSNCHKIGLGHGVPGTILEMPAGCGPGKYAVAKDMKPARNQTVPAHIAKRSRGPNPVVYDLTFDYDFTRVPRDQGVPQIRIDYSNQKGYWDAIVDHAGDKRRRNDHWTTLAGTTSAGLSMPGRRISGTIRPAL